MTDAVDVVCGIIIKDNKFLVERRRQDDPIDAGYIAIPSGHVDKGESLEKALEREMREELDVYVKKTKFVFKDIYVASNGERELCHYFVINEWNGKPSNNEAEEIFWESDIKKLTTDIDRRALKIALKR